MPLRKRKVGAQMAKLQPQKKDALLDLKRLVVPHADEAERMRIVGNTHMAAKEYHRAYNAYSAALQLSPEGPSSHILLCNRAASLLGLKRYAAAAIDAKRAIDLDPTFAKAHHRAGQAFYLGGNYQRAVSSYQTAMELEPDNRVILTHIEKAQARLMQRYERAAARGIEEAAIIVEESDTVAEETIVNSTATYPNLSAAVALKEAEVHYQQDASSAATGENWSLEQYEEEDPDTDSALLIQERANQFLGLKQCKRAVEECSPALFLVPGDPPSTPALRLGRAHALNGLRRQELSEKPTFVREEMDSSHSFLNDVCFFP